MTTVAERLEMGPDEFAFHFEARQGVDADALATFLKRAATVVRRSGGELRVVGLRDGSLDVVLKAIKRGATKEFKEKPIDTTIKTSVFVAGIVAGIIHLMSPQLSGGTPIAKAGADIIENHSVTTITVLTNESSATVMNQAIAKEVREAQGRQNLLEGPDPVPRLAAPVAGMLRDARSGDLSGDTSVVMGELHFRPDGYRYWVPIEENPITSNGSLKPGARYRVSGHIAMSGGQPDRIIVDRATPIPD
jgi:hypothetical protein